MGIDLNDLLGKAAPYLLVEWVGDSDLQRKFIWICKTKYATPSHAFLALSVLQGKLMKHWPWETKVYDSQVYKAVDQKMKSLMGGILPGNWVTITSGDPPISQLVFCPSVPQDVQEVKQNTEEPGEQKSLLDLPNELREQILSEVGFQSSKAARTCQELKAIHEDLLLRRVQKLRNLDATSHLLSGIGITFPEPLTVENASRVLKKICATLCLIAALVPGVDQDITIGKLVLNPLELESFLRKIKDTSLVQGLGQLANIPPDCPMVERRKLVEQWLSKADLQQVIDNLPFFSYFHSTHKSITEFSGHSPVESLIEGLNDLCGR